MKKILFLLVIPSLSFGQGWEQIFGATPSGSGYYGTSAKQVQDGGYIVCGGTHFTQSVLFGMTPLIFVYLKPTLMEKSNGPKPLRGNYWDFGKSIRKLQTEGILLQDT